MVDHDEANRLLDCAHSAEAFSEELARIERQYPPAQAANMERLAKWQMRMYRDSRRVFGWRYQWRTQQ